MLALLCACSITLEGSVTSKSTTAAAQTTAAQTTAAQTTTAQTTTVQTTTAQTTAVQTTTVQTTAAEPAGAIPPVTELYAEEGTATAEDGTAFDYAYHVPQLGFDTPDAREINGEIRAYFGQLAEESLDCIAGKEVPFCVELGYRYYENGDVLSLVLHRTDLFGSYETFEVYNYDTAAGVRLDNAAILDRAGLSDRAAFAEAVCRTAAQSFDAMQYPVWEESGLDVIPGLYPLLRARTLERENLSGTPLYLGEDGALQVILPLASFGEAEITYCPAALAPVPSGTLTAAYGDYLTARLEDGVLTLRFERTAESEALMEYCGADGGALYGRDIPVQGAFSVYTDLAFGICDEMGKPYLFLRTDCGRLEYVDLCESLSGGYFCTGGPLMGLSWVSSLCSGEDGMLRASDYWGNAVALSPLLWQERETMSEDFYGDWTAYVTHEFEGSGRETFYSLTLSGCGEVGLQISVFEEELTALYEGVFTFRGVTEDGMIYSYSFWEAGEDGAPWNGTAALRLGWEISEESFSRTLTVRELGGEALICGEPGTETVLTETFG